MTKHDLEKARDATPEYEALATARDSWVTAREGLGTAYQRHLIAEGHYYTARKRWVTAENGLDTASEIHKKALDAYRATPEHKAWREAQDD